MSRAGKLWADDEGEAEEATADEGLDTSALELAAALHEEVIVADALELEALAVE